MNKDDRKKRRQERRDKRRVNQPNSEPKQKVSKSGLTIESAPEEDAKITTAAQKLKDYEARQAEIKEKNKITSTTKLIPQTASGNIIKRKADGHLAVSSEKAKSKQESSLSIDGRELTREEKADRRLAKKNSIESKENEEVSSTEDEYVAPKGKKTLTKQEKRKIKKKKEREERKEKSEPDKTPVKDKVEKKKIKSESSLFSTKEERKKKKKLNQIARTTKMVGKVYGKITEGSKLLVRGEPITEKEAKGSHVSKILQARLARRIRKGNEEGMNIPDGGMGKEAFDTYNQGLDALEGEDKASMARRGMKAGGASDRDIATVEYLKPTDYYPQVGRSIGVGTTSGEIIGSRTIYSGSGVLAPQGLYDARRRALKAAAKKGIAGADGFPDMPSIRNQYNEKYKEDSKALIDKLQNDPKYWEGGLLTNEAREMLLTHRGKGENVNMALKQADKYVQDVKNQQVTGKGEVTSGDDFYYEKGMIKFSHKLLEAGDEISELTYEDFDGSILTKIAKGEGMSYRNLMTDFQAGPMTTLRGSTGQDRTNYKNGKATGIKEGGKISDYYDTEDGRFTSAYVEEVLEPRIRDAVEAMFNNGDYSKEQIEPTIKGAVAQFGKRETIQAANDQSANASRHNPQAAYNNTFTIQSRGFYERVVPRMEELTNASKNGEISRIYATEIGGQTTVKKGDGTTGLLLTNMMGGKDVPVTAAGLTNEGSPTSIGGAGGATPLFAVMVGNGSGGVKHVNADDLVKLLGETAEVRSWSTGNVIINNKPTKDYFRAIANPSEFGGTQTEAVAVSEISCMGYIDKNGLTIPLNESNIADFNGSSNKVQLKTLMYRVVVQNVIGAETDDVEGNFNTNYFKSISSPGVQLVGKTYVIDEAGGMNTRMAAQLAPSVSTDKSLKKVKN